MMVAWPAKDSFGGYGYLLQTGSDVLGPYTLDGNAPVPNGATNVVTETPTLPQQFWRMVYPPRSGNYGTY